MRNSQNIVIVEPYSESAQIYDLMMEGVDYSGWSEYILDILEMYLIDGKTLCDISCGTGTLLAYLASSFDKVCGIDSSEAMLQLMTKNYPDIPNYRADMTAVPESCKSDIYINIHDALNYYDNEKDIINHLKYYAGIMTSRQVYFFDFAMKPLIDTYFDGVEEKGEDGNGNIFQRINNFDRLASLCMTDVYISNKAENSPIYLEKHIQKIYTLGQIKEMCSQVDDCHFMFFEEFTFSVADEKSQRLMVVMIRD